MSGPTGLRRRSASFADLEAAARAGQAWAIDGLADRFVARLSSFAKARGAADPDGIADISFLHVVNRLDRLRFEAEQQMWAYLCQTARSRIIDEHRARKPVELVGDGSTLDRRIGGDLLEDQIADKHYVDDLLSPLTLEQRQVLEMRFLDDLSIEETAYQTGRTAGAVKGLQRRAINAIIAAFAILLVVLAARGFGNDESTRGISGDPARQLQVPDDGTDDGTNDGTGDDAERSLSAEETDAPALSVDVDAVEPAPQASTVELPPSEPPTAEEPPTDFSPTDASPVDVSPVDVSPVDVSPTDIPAQFTLTTGSARATALNTSGQPGSSNAHGVRIYCPVSHLSYDDPIRFAGQPGAASAQLYWGNTSADAFTDGPNVADSGNSTCEGGTTERSAYWMPAMFNESEQVVLPEKILVEYKSFGGPSFDRGTVQPIPTGLELLSDPDVPNATWQIGTPVQGDDNRVVMSIRFPSCVAVDQLGQPLLSSADGRSHLSYADGKNSNNANGGGSSDCPTTHPYRIPQLLFTIEYEMPFGSGWYLSSDVDSTSANRGATAGAISGMDPSAMAGVVTCNRDLLLNCDFVERVADGDRYREQLPERFASPTGDTLYLGSVTLANGADRTPFDDTITAIR